ncbi:hypothetical protein CY35_05G129000 [Sphagnum magellanicum]|nr:hypothetical protein CY35_05G129000 [Sphagnum magellanicum]
MSSSPLDRRATLQGSREAGQTVVNSSTPCAACKLLRRRCAQECPFSPYFSPHEPQKFACVHKIFGASNISKMLMDVPESQRADAASSLVYEANARIRDPVYGCIGAISALQQQAQSLQAELNAVRQEIKRYGRHDNSALLADATTAVTAAMQMVSAAGAEYNHQAHNLHNRAGAAVVANTLVSTQQTAAAAEVIYTVNPAANTSSLQL